MAPKAELIVCRVTVKWNTTTAGRVKKGSVILATGRCRHAVKGSLLLGAAVWPLVFATPALAQSTPDPLEEARDRARDVAERQAEAPQEAPDPGGDIVPDTQFREALPPLDAELTQPLAPIEDIDAAPIEQAAPATPTVPPAPGQPLPPATATAAPDPALAEPLPPLATFDVNPPAAAVAESGTPAPTIRYSVTVEGLDEIGLETRFRSLSALDDGDGEAANGAVINARAREDEGLALRILRSEGYYDGIATSLVEPVTTDASRVSATITAVPGRQYKFGTIAITGPETVPAGLARTALRLQSGDPIVAAAVEGAEAAISLRLPEQGYPFVKVGERDIVLDSETVLGDYTLPVDPGPRSSFGGYSTTGDLAFDAEHVGILARFEAGELYDNRRVDDLREAMVATGLFDSVAVEPRRTGRIAADGTEVVDLLVTQDAGPPRRLAATAGYSTGQGFRIDGSWTHKNLFPPEGSLTVAGIAGTQEQGLNVLFRRYNAGRRDRTVLLSAGANRQDYDAYEALTFGINGRISLDSTPIWQKRWTWAYGFEALATREDTFKPVLGLRENQNFFIGGINGQLGFDSSDSLLDPTKGFRALLRLSPEISQSEGRNDQYVRGLIEGSGYFPVSESIVLAGRVRLGSIVNAARDDIAPSRRLYAGGGGSVRGFGYQQLGPRVIEPNPDFNPEEPDEEPAFVSNPIGGRSLFEAAIEARYRFGNFGIVPFVDVGQVYEDSMPGFSDLRFGAGIGGRFYTNFGPLRLDVATPLGRREGESVVAVYISIGQAF